MASQEPGQARPQALQSGERPASGPRNATRTATQTGTPAPENDQPGSNRTSAPKGSLKAIAFHTTETEYFVAAFLPTLLAILFTIPWKIIHHEVKSLEPFHRMANQDGMTVNTAIRLEYAGLRGYFAPVLAVINQDWAIAFSALLEAGSAIVAPLASEAVDMKLVGDCDDFDSRGCAAVAQVIPQIVRIIQVIIGLMSFGIIALLIITKNRNSGLANDPRSIIGVAALMRRSDTRWAFGGEISGANLLTVQDVRGRLGGRKLRVSGFIDGYYRPDYGIHVGRGKSSEKSDSEDSPPQRLSPPSAIPVLRMCVYLSVFATFLAGFIALIYYYLLTMTDSPFERFMGSGNFGGRFLFACCGVAINFAWLAVFNDVMVLIPYYRMFSRSRTADASVLMPYATNPYSRLVASMRRGDFLIWTLAFIAVLSDFLPLLLTTVPYYGATSYQAHIICSWISVGILTLMFAVLCCLLAYLTLARPRLLVHPDLIRDCPLVAAMVLAANSKPLVDQLQGMAALGSLERDQAVREMGLRFSLGSARAMDEGCHAGMDVATRTGAA